MVKLTKIILSNLFNISKNHSKSFEKFKIWKKISKLNSKEIGNPVTVHGWIQNIRKMKSSIFLDLNDGSCCESIQIVAPKFENKHLGIGQSVKVSGDLQKSPQMKLEITTKDEIEVIGPCNVHDGYPFTPKQIHNPEYVREYLHLRSRIKYMQSIFRIRHEATKILNDFMYENDFIQIHTPILTANDCEGAGEGFLVRPENELLLKQMAKNDNKNLNESYFDRNAYLSVSGQFHLEAMAHGLGNCYTFSPAFRAENSKSNLHLSEFYMFEAELIFIEDLKELNRFIEEMLKTITKKILNTCEKDLHNCNNEELDFKWLEREWTTITYCEAMEILLKEQQNIKTAIKPNEGFSKEQELFLVNYFSSPVFLVDWPKTSKPFYMKQSISDPTKVHAVDLLMPKVGELAGGSLRENNFNILKNSVPSGINWYLDLRKFGSVPSGGFGLGFERYLQLITNVKNIRDVIPFPRYPHSCEM